MLAEGTCLGPYKIAQSLGAGGMGEVYRALDTRLDRVVAIKILAAHLADSPAARERPGRTALSTARNDAVKYRFVSDLPFKGRESHNLDGWEVAALASLRTDPNTPVVQVSGSVFDRDIRLAVAKLCEQYPGEYWRKLDRESDRMKLVRIGTTAEGRPMWMAIVTSPENHRRLARYQEISRRLARAEDLTEAQARAFAAEGRAADHRAGASS